MISRIDLSGVWGFRIDGEKAGINGKFWELPANDEIFLPSTTSQQKKGSYNAAREEFHLTDEYSFEGYAWYYRNTDLSGIPDGTRAELYLERTRLTKVWINGNFIGERSSLCTPHIYDITDYIGNGSTDICIMVSNTDYPTKGGHMTSPDTQTDWNGITGEISVRLSDVDGISFIRAFPDISSHSVRLEFTLRGMDEADVNIWGASSDCKIVDTATYRITAEQPFAIVDLGEDVSLWDEYSPVIYTLKAAIDGSMDIYTVQFGMREITADGMTMKINGKPLYLRGKHDAMLFPLSGAAPTAVNEWYEVLRKAKELGINHYRFHTCCPPDSAFAAADMLGMYLQPELPFWGTLYFSDDERYNAEETAYIREEGRRILREFGGHPSFVMFTLGNELWGDDALMNDMLGEYKAIDSRHLYSQGSNNFQFMPKILENDDFFTGVRFGKKRLIRGSYAQCDAPLGFVQTDAPNTSHSFDGEFCEHSDNGGNAEEFEIQRETSMVKVKAEQAEKLTPTIPVISHETGQYYSYPDLNAVSRYTGSLKAHFLDIYRERLAKNSMLGYAEDFHKASGLFAFQCYKLEIEAAMRSEKLSGFQLLDLQDFTGQGVASVGMLDAFMNEKFFFTDELRRQWTGFCSDAVIPAEIDSFVLEIGQEVEIPVFMRYMRPEPLNGSIEWNVGNVSGRLDIPENFRGFGHIGNIHFIAGSDIRCRLTLTVRGVTENCYDLWCFPKADSNFQLAECSEKGDSKVFITDSAEQAEMLLNKGEKVILFPKKLNNSIRGMYCTDFWNYPMFRRISEDMGREVPVGTLGLLINKEHPTMKKFGAEIYSTPQWYNIVTHGECAILDGTPENFRPIVQVIDNAERNHKLGLLFETVHGMGKLLVCTCRIWEVIDRPEVQYFADILIEYAHSDSFAPTSEIDMPLIRHFS